MVLALLHSLLKDLLALALQLVERIKGLFDSDNCWVLADFLRVLALRNQGRELILSFVEQLKGVTMHCKFILHGLVGLHGDLSLRVIVIQLSFELSVE